MSKQSDNRLEYDLESFVGPLDERQLSQFESWLERNGWGNGRLKFDRSYIEHIREFHGGVPQMRCFRTVDGTVKVITRFFHFADLPTSHPLRDSNVKTAWSQANDRLGDYLMPFADLFAGDMLCFDYKKPGRPRVVVWFHEESLEEAPYTEFVAENFDDFLTKLYKLPE